MRLDVFEAADAERGLGEDVERRRLGPVVRE
jgi:hypothetical protein